MRTRFLWAFLILTMAGIGASFLLGQRVPSVTSRSVPEPGTTSVYGRVPPFTLVRQDGLPFQSETLADRVWIADFIFTSCAGTCPQMSQRMSRLQRRLPSELQLVSFSVDPKRDSPEVLSQYARRYHAQPGRWHFLTGSVQQIQALAQEGFALSVAKGTDPKEPITHSVRFVLVDQKGRIRGYYDSTEPKATDRLVNAAKELLENRQHVTQRSADH